MKCKICCNNGFELWQQEIIHKCNDCIITLHRQNEVLEINEDDESLEGILEKALQCKPNKPHACMELLIKGKTYDEM